jgi:hypothetical protein
MPTDRIAQKLFDYNAAGRRERGRPLKWWRHQFDWIGTDYKAQSLYMMMLMVNFTVYCPENHINNVLIMIYPSQPLLLPLI